VKIRILVLSVAVALMPVLTFGQAAKPAANTPAASPIVTPDQLVWKPLIPGVESAVVSGNPDRKGGLYVIRIRAQSEVKVPPHWHVTDEHVTVLEGSFWMARGDKFDATKLQELKVGAHATMPARARHFGLHGAEMWLRSSGSRHSSSTLSIRKTGRRERVRNRESR